MKKVVAVPEYCMGCGLCEVYCIEAHSFSKDLVKAYLKERPKQISRIKVQARRPLSFAVQCRHCIDAPCVDACITGSLSIDTVSGAVIHDSQRCIGCLSCIMVCPVGAIQIAPNQGVIAKCDLCGMTGTPVCVEKCPNQALIYAEDN